MLIREESPSHKQTIELTRTPIVGTLKDILWLLNGCSSILQVVPNFGMAAGSPVSCFCLSGSPTQNNGCIVVVVKSFKDDIFLGCGSHYDHLPVTVVSILIPILRLSLVLASL